MAALGTRADIRGHGEFTLPLPRGYSAEIKIERDEDMGPPWEEHDGHGPVSDWVSRDKHAGEWLLCSDRSSRRYYDAAGANAQAKAEGWGIGPEELAKLAAKLKRTPTKGEIRAAAVVSDFERMQGWCDDSWCWMYYCVTVYDKAGREISSDSCGGYDGDGEYFRGEIASHINYALEQHAETLKTQRRLYRKECLERAYWEARDTVTI